MLSMSKLSLGISKAVRNQYMLWTYVGNGKGQLHSSSLHLNTTPSDLSAMCEPLEEDFPPKRLILQSLPVPV